VIVEGSLPATLDASAQEHHARRALSDIKRHLQKSTLKLVGYLLAAYVVLKLIPTLKQALRSLEHVSWEWVLGAIALEVLSELGFVLAWGEIVDPQELLDRDGRGRRTDDDVAWAQLAAGLLLPGGAWGGVGVGALILHRLGVPTKLIAEREFNLSFLNTAIDALALIVFGVGLATGILAGEPRLLLTVLPAAVAATGIAAALLIAPRASSHAERLQTTPPRSQARSPHSPTPWTTPSGCWPTAAAGGAWSGCWPTSDSTCSSCGLPSSPSIPTHSRGSRS
jgi:uncharacterized membrane protein YbhN (UPF0104 family)